MLYIHNIFFSMVVHVWPSEPWFSRTSFRMELCLVQLSKPSMSLYLSKANVLLAQLGRGCMRQPPTLREGNEWAKSARKIKYSTWTNDGFASFTWVESHKIHVTQVVGPASFKPPGVGMTNGVLALTLYAFAVRLRFWCEHKVNPLKRQYWCGEHWKCYQP